MAIKDAQEFIDKTKEFVVDLKDANEWVSTVMQSEKPVILDCYAG